MPATTVIKRRYILEHPIGSGGMGVVYQAVDRLTKQRVALKRLLIPTEMLEFLSKSSSDGILLSLAREFQFVSSLRHPYIVNVLDYGFDDQEQPYLVSELLHNPKPITADAASLSQDEKLNLLLQLLQALAYLHRRSIFHRDLKPNNVLVVDTSVKVLDFGLSVSRGEQRGVEGTVAYIAPEVLNGGPVSEAADLYAVGVIGYELFAGKLPFTSADAEVLFDSILSQSPDFTGFTTPPSVISILQRLLEKDPILRYSSASAVIADIVPVLGQQTLETSAVRDSFLQAADFVGREQELQSLVSALEQANRGKGSAWLIGGESGVGKSRLLDELRIQALVQGIHVLQGQAVSEGGTPYQLWQQVLKNLVLLNNVDLMEASILKPVVDGVDALLEMPIPNPPDLTPESAQKRLHNTIASLLRRVSGTVLILLEDLHWASSESLGLLTHLNRLAPQLSVLLIGTYRDDEYPHFRASLPEMRLIHLARLAQEEIVQLSHSMIGDAAKSHHVADFLQRETEGNVYFLIEVVRALAEEAGQLDRIGRMTLPERVFAGGVQQIVQRRLARVSDSTRRLLNLAAVAGRILDEAILQVAVPEADLTSWLTECADAAILEVRENRWRFAHDKLRETLLAGLTEVEQAALHRTVASALEQVYPQAEEYLSALAHHWRMAGDQDKEIHYAELAAQQALKTSANRQAIPLLKRVLELFPSRENAEDHLRYAQLQLLLGRAHLGLSAFTEARQYFYAALSIAEQFDDQKLAAYALDALGNIAMRQGDFEGGRVKFEKSLELFQALDWKEGMARPLNNLGIIKRLAGEFEAAQSYLKRSMEVAAEVGWKEGIAHPLVNLGIVHSQLAEFEASNHAFEQALLIYQEIGAKAGMVRVYNNLSTNAARQQKFEEAKEHLHHALALARETNEKEILAIILLNLGTLAADKMQLQEAYSHLCESLRTSMEIGIIPIAVQVMPSFAKVFLKLKAFERAAEIIMFTIQHPQCTSETRTSAEDEKQQVEKAQPELDWETAIAKAKTFSIEQLAETLFSENPVP